MGDEARSDECERMGWWERDLGQPMVKDGGFYVLAKPETSYLDDEMSKFFGALALLLSRTHYWLGA